MSELGKGIEFAKRDSVADMDFGGCRVYSEINIKLFSGIKESSELVLAGDNVFNSSV